MATEREALNLQAWVVRMANNAIQWINHYPVDSVVCFVITYPLDNVMYLSNYCGSESSRNNTFCLCSRYVVLQQTLQKLCNH